MAWFYTVLLAVCSVGILGYALALTRRLFRDEVQSGAPADRPEPPGMRG